MTERVTRSSRRAGYLSDDPPTAEGAGPPREAMPLIAERINKLTEAVDMLGLPLRRGGSFTRDPANVEKLLDAAGRQVVQAAYDALDGMHHWSTAAIQEALQAALVEGLGLKPRNAFGPVRVAVTGRRVSPPLFESMELLGRDRSLARRSERVA